MGIESVKNREKFKDFVNTLATIKFDENNEKILVLKKKFRTDANSTLDSSTASRTSDDIKYDSVRAQSEPPFQPSKDTKQISQDSCDGANLSRDACKSEGTINTNSNNKGPTMSNAASSSMGSISTSSLASETSVFDDEGNVSVVSVKERAKHLNRIESESDVLSINRINTRNLSKSSRDSHDDDSQSSGVTYVTLDAEEKEWLVTVSSAEYHPIAKLVSKNQALAKLKDFTNTGLHWAAKHGKPEVIKLIAPKPGVNVNHRSGYTPLHVAAMHGHEDIIELLVSTYKADSNIRDYSGKKAKQYLKNSASTRAQQLLLSRKLSGSQDPTSMRVLDNNFMRSSSFRKSNRARSTVINSLIQASGTIGKNQELLRSSWSGSAEYINRERKPGQTPPGSAGTSPRELRREFRQSLLRNVFTSGNQFLMPPPQTYSVGRKRKGFHSSSQENITEDNHEESLNGVLRSESEPNLQKLEISGIDSQV